MLRVYRLTLCLVLFGCVSLGALATPRYVTAGGTITEIVFALGAGKDVVAVDQSSSFPYEATQKPMVGYYRDLAAEGVLSMTPTHLLAIEGVGRDNALKQIESVGVKVTVFDKPKDVNELKLLVKSVGKELGKVSEAETLVTHIEASLPKKSLAKRGSAVYLLSAGERGIMAAGEETVPDLIFSYVGLENVANTHSGFKAINLEALVTMQPDYILLPSHVFAHSGGKEAFCKQTNLRLLSAVRECRVLLMDSLLSLGMTPRLSKAIQQVDQFVGE